ncbi:MAG: 6-phosphofructokinase [Ilumatobacteraceae bacterium]
MDRGHQLLAVTGGFHGRADGAIEELEWRSVSGWVARPGAELGTSKFVPGPDDLGRIAAQLTAHQVDGILLIGGWAGYEAAHQFTATQAITTAWRSRSCASRPRSTTTCRPPT